MNKVRKRILESIKPYAEFIGLMRQLSKVKS